MAYLNQSKNFNTLYVVGSTESVPGINPVAFISIHYMLLVQSIMKEQLQKQYQISIHYMLLVQMGIELEVGELYYFNTLYVVGSKATESPILITKEFQYIICCWFNNAHIHI